MHFSIIMPTYKRSNQVTQAIESVIQQDHDNWLLYVIDDCSPDDTQERIAQFVAQDNRIIYHRQESNSGVNAARNVGLDLALSRPTDFVTFLDDDDIFTPSALSAIVQFTSQKPNLAWITTQCESNNPKLPITKMDKAGHCDYILDYLMGRSVLKGDATHFITPNTIKHHRFSRTIKQAEEWIFFMALSKEQSPYLLKQVSKTVSYQKTGLLASKPNRRDRYEIRWQRLLWADQLRPNNPVIKKKKRKLFHKWVIYRLVRFGRTPISIPERYE